MDLAMDSGLGVLWGLGQGGVLGSTSSLKILGDVLREITLLKGG